MECVGILQHTVARAKVIAVIQVIFERIIRRFGYARGEHLLGDRNVNVGPDRVRSHDVVTKLCLLEHAVLMGFVVASPQNLPTLSVDVAHTLNDGIVLDARTCLVDRNTLRIQRNRNLVGIGIAWN